MGPPRPKRSVEIGSRKRAERKGQNREKKTREPQFMRNHRKSFIMLGFMAVALFTSATAQETNKSKPEPSLTSAREKTVINIWPGVAPGSEQWKQPETVIGSAGNQRIMNVSAPTLTAYLP